MKAHSKVNLFHIVLNRVVINLELSRDELSVSWSQEKTHRVGSSWRLPEEERGIRLHADSFVENKITTSLTAQVWAASGIVLKRVHWGLNDACVTRCHQVSPGVSTGFKKYESEQRIWVGFLVCLQGEPPRGIFNWFAGLIKVGRFSLRIKRMHEN